jgi:hypothetical protein
MKKVCILLISVLVVTFGVQAQLHGLAGKLETKQVTTAVSSLGGGMVIAQYNAATKLLEVFGNFRNLSAAHTAVHVHGPASPGNTGPILFTLTAAGGTSGTISGTATLSTGEQGELLSGRMYVDVHTTGVYATPGEVRAQLEPIPPGQSVFLNSRLQGTQQVPPTTSRATGMTYVLIDKLANRLYVSGNYSGLLSAATSAHIHRGATGTAGPVITPLTYTTTSTGSFDTARVITNADIDSIVSGRTYVDIHTFTNAGGEIRGQLTNLTLPVKLSYFNGYKDRNQIALLWESVQEIDAKSYEVEQLNIETGEWVTKASITANGGNTTRKYRFDDIPALGRKEYVLYRLKMIDEDGQFAYSSIIRINYSQAKTGLTIIPNPVINNKLRFTITGIAREQKAEISVVDLGGRTLFKTVVSSSTNNNIDISSLSKGMYRLVVKINDDTILQESFSKL